MTKDLTELRDFKVKEVSVVDKGANKKKRFPIFKQEKPMNEEIMKAVLETEVEGEANLQEFIDKSELDEGGIDAAKGALRILSSFKDKLPEGTISKLAEIAGYDQPIIKEAKKEEAPQKEEEEEEEETEMKKSLEGVSEEVKKQFEDIQKEHQAQVDALKAKNEEIEKALKEEKDRRELETWVAKAKEELDGIPGKTAEELGTELKKLADVDTEIADSQFNVLKASAEAIKEGNLLKELGGRGMDVAGSAMDKINKLAEKLIEKSSGELTKEQARVKIMDENPSLYTQYMAEHPEQQGRN